MNTPEKDSTVRKSGHSKLVYDKATKAIVSVDLSPSPRDWTAKTIGDLHLWLEEKLLKIENMERNSQREIFRHGELLDRITGCIFSADPKKHSQT